MRFPLAREGIFRTIQGEGHLLGLPMVFVRLAGCPISCPGCDTDFAAAQRLTAGQIVEQVERIRGKAEWVWITGGEPAIHDLRALMELLGSRCQRIALATSGHYDLGGARCNFVSVSPHGKPGDLVVQRASQINLVPGLNGLDLKGWQDFDFTGFGHKYVTPLDGEGSADSLQRCLEWLDQHQGWRLGCQAHKSWGIP